jgi:P-type Cu+ transporter
MTPTCFHCNEQCDPEDIVFDDKHFCCNGCLTVYQLFEENDLSCYYELNPSSGTSPKAINDRYQFLEAKEIQDRFIEFDQDGVQVVELAIPAMHCSSCIWVLEHLHQLNTSVKQLLVNFPEKKIRVTYSSQTLTLRGLVELLSRIGYAPDLSLEQFEFSRTKVDRSLWMKIGVAGFAFGNIMLFSFPEYFEEGEFWIEQYKTVFRWLMLIFSIPVVFYAGFSYITSAIKGLRARILNIDVPIAMGILTLFIRSSIDVVLDLGSGFFDSLSGLVFFLLLGRLFQQKTYGYLSFERDYKSYFPISATRIREGIEETIPIYKITIEDELLIRNQELIPVDAILQSDSAELDYRFVTGESRIVTKYKGDLLYAGGRHTGPSIQVKVAKALSQSYLTQLWSNAAFKQEKSSGHKTVTDSISKHFTVAVLTIAIISTSFWLGYRPEEALNVFTAVLIIACPCAIALAAPFTQGNLLRYFGRLGFYVKDTNSLERMAHLEQLVFDKTGTLSQNDAETIDYKGQSLSNQEQRWVASVLRSSNHPLSRALYKKLKTAEMLNHFKVTEFVGKGLEASIDNHLIRLGSAEFIGHNSDKCSAHTEVHLSIDNTYFGAYYFHSTYRKGLQGLFGRLAPHYQLSILSGDNATESRRLQALLPKGSRLNFNQDPHQKLDYIMSLQQHSKVAMIGDGLNDAGALAQSDIGIAVSEDVNVFSPACDAIIDARSLKYLDRFLAASKSGMRIIKNAFIFSLFYNLIGLGFAVSGALEPVVAAILMPLSSISIVVFTSLSTKRLYRKIYFDY